MNPPVPLNEEEIAEWERVANMRAPVGEYEMENPVGIISRLREPDQIIQPWQFGHGETKATCFWLRNLPPLHSTHVVEGREARVHRMAPGPNRWAERSRTLPGIAAAMAEQWGRPWPVQMEMSA